MKRGVIFALSLVLLFLHASCNEDGGTGGPILQPPTIASITPDEASRAESGIATIVGTNFTGAVGVFLGNEVTIQRFNVINPTTIEVNFIVNTNASAGRRPVQVTTAAGTATANDLFRILDNRAPLSRLIVEPTNGATNTVYTFSGLTSDDPDGNIVRFEFEFGDGKRAVGPVVTHKYSNTGTYEVKMIVIDNDDAQGSTTANVNVREGVAPVAKFVVQPKDGDVNTIYTLDASNSTDADGSIKNYSWDFGNGKTASGLTTTFTSRTSGVFSVTLVVTDNDGLQNASRKDITVGAFNPEKATAEIRAVVQEFFRRYSNIHRYTADEITINWSESPGCRGKNHEMNIIENQKTIIQQTQATPGNIDVTFNSFLRAHAIAPADFAWTNFDGSSHTGFAVHDFEFIFESGKWQICNFVLI